MRLLNDLLPACRISSRSCAQSGLPGYGSNQLRTQRVRASTLSRSRPRVECSMANAAEAARRTHKASYPRLLNGQRAWLRYRDETCGWVKDTFGGTIAAMNYFDCMEDMTRKRTEELKMLATNPNSGEPL